MTAQPLFLCLYHASPGRR